MSGRWRFLRDSKYEKKILGDGAGGLLVYSEGAERSYIPRGMTSLIHVMVCHWLGQEREDASFVYPGATGARGRKLTRSYRKERKSGSGCFSGQISSNQSM